MNLIDDPQRVVADLRPAALDWLAEEGYRRHRAADLARVLGERAARTPHGRRLALAARRPPVLLGAVAGLAAAAVAAAVVITLPSSHGHQPAGTPAGASASGATSATSANGSQAILLTAAHTAAGRPAATGTYWYVKERDFEPTAPGGKGKYPKQKAKPAADYTAAYAATQETWTSATRTRTVVNEDLVFDFASAADRAKWQAAGSPKLANPAGQSGLTGPATSNYAFGGYSYNIGSIKVSLATARKLPTTPGKLDAMLRTAWQRLTPAQRQATVGLPAPTYAQYVFQVAGALLTGPVTPGTRAAVYGLLAKQPGLTTATNVTDPLGRVGTAIGDGNGDFLVISPATADVLDQTTYPVRSGATILGNTGSGTEAYLSLSWTNRLP
ncbi:MAG TPA: CU044_5270 family protein [Trebonia sp.]|nr:CU044_5270 family protein [Trebonia sp.]